MAAIQQRHPQMGMQPPQPSPGHAPGHPQGPHVQIGQQIAGQMVQGQGQNPAMKIPYPLLPHVHLKSHQLYPITRHPTIPAIVQYLKEALRVVNQLQPVEWTYLDPPREGTIILVWQAPGQLQFASDGYWWCDAETQQTKLQGSYNLEIYSQRVGYLPGETVATHARTRYRLTPNGPPNQAPCDPCLWIIRYSRADVSRHIAVNRVPQNQQMAAIMQQRSQIEKAGRLVRKPFMLTDVANWPTLQVPESLMRPRAGSQAMEDLHAAKRQRHDEGKDDDEVLETIEVNPPPGEDDDKDIFDLLTPRDISMHRYARHNEWMEEMFASPYAISNIKPASLGLGRGGALRKLTKAFYQPALDERLIRQPDKYTGGDDIAREYTSDEVSKFESDVQAYLQKTREESEALTKRHERALTQLRDKTLFGDAEVRLRHAVLNPDAPDPLDIESGSHFHYTSQRRKQELIEDIVEEVSAKLGGQVPQEAPKFQCVSQGGYQTPPPPPSPPAEEDDDEEDEEMGDDEGQFVDFASQGGGGLSAQPHPDTQKGKEGEEGWVVLDKDKAETATNGAPAAEGAQAQANQQQTTDPADDMLDFGADDDDGEGGGGGDFGASLDFGDLPEGGDEDEEGDDGSEGEGMGEDDDDEDEDEEEEAGNQESGPGEGSGAESTAPAGVDTGDEQATGNGEQEADSTIDSAFADALTASDDVGVSALSAPVAAPGDTLVPTSTAAANAAVAPATTAHVPTPPAAPLAAGETAHEGDDIVMGESGGDESGQGREGGDTSGQGEGEGTGEGSGVEGMEFDDSAFGDAFHHTEFEAVE